MKKSIFAPIKNYCLVLVLLAAGLFTNSAMAQPGQHPYYMHALSDLRAARWMIEHRPGNWQQTQDEINAVKQIDAAIHDIIKASIDDGKNIADHPPVDERPDRMGRLHKAVEFLQKAHQDINHDEDNYFANGLRNNSFKHIDAAVMFVRNAMRANF